MRLRLSPLILLFLVVGSYARAETDLDVTMRTVPEGEPVSENVMRRIELPEGAAERARENARKGLERAGEASEKGREALDGARQRARKGLEQRPGRGDVPVPGKPGRSGRDSGDSGGDAPVPAPERPDRPESEQPERGDPR